MLFAETLQGAAAGVLTPAIAVISLGLVGRRAMSRRVGLNRRFKAAGSALTAALMGTLGSTLGKPRFSWRRPDWLFRHSSHSRVPPPDVGDRGFEPVREGVPKPRPDAVILRQTIACAARHRRYTEKRSADDSRQRILATTSDRTLGIKRTDHRKVTGGLGNQMRIPKTHGGTQNTRRQGPPEGNL